MKYLLTIAITALVCYGINSARELDGIVGHVNLTPQPTTIGMVTQDIDVSNLVHDTAVLILPNSDLEESINGDRSNNLLSVTDLGSDDNYAYSLEQFRDYSQVTQIPLKVFPNWFAADQLEGFSTRGTDTWCEVASLNTDKL